MSTEKLSQMRIQIYWNATDHEVYFLIAYDKDIKDGTITSIYILIKFKQNRGFLLIIVIWDHNTYIFMC